MLSREALDNMGFAAVGDNVQISDRASLYGVGRITIGSHVRIDDFCVLAAGASGIELGSYVHIGSGCRRVYPSIPAVTTTPAPP